MNDHKDVPQGLKPSCRVVRGGTAEAVPFVEGIFPSGHGAVCSRSRFRVSRKGPRNCRSLGSPGFPVESCGFGQLHVVLFRENHISGPGESCEVGNPGTLGMTKERATVPERVVAGPK